MAPLKPCWISGTLDTSPDTILGLRADWLAGTLRDVSVKSTVALKIDAPDTPFKAKKNADMPLWHVSFKYGNKTFSRETCAPDSEAAFRRVAGNEAEKYSGRSRDTDTPVTSEDFLRDSTDVQVSRIEVTGGLVISESSFLEMALPMLEEAVSQYWGAQQSQYQKIHMTEEDVRGHAMLEVLVKRFLPMVRDKPEYILSRYRSRAALGRSFYSSVKRACFGHYRFYIQTQCRGGIIRSGRVELDASNVEGMRPAIVAERDVTEEAIISGAPDEVTAKMCEMLLDGTAMADLLEVVGEEACARLAAYAREVAERSSWERNGGQVVSQSV